MSNSSDTRSNKKESRQEKRRVGRDIKTSKRFNKFIQFTLGNWLERNFNAVSEDREVFKTVEPPYFIMSTHNSVFDPFLIADFVPEPVSYIVTDAAFRKKIMGWALGLVGSIPKTKGISDMSTIKNMMKIKSKGGVLGLFPEGQNPWDGHSFPVIYSTAKLVKMMKIPVIIADKQGVYFSMPRWAKSRRKGKVTINFTLGLSVEEIKRFTPDEIYQRLSELLEHDEYELQRRDMIRFTGKERAEYLELVLFICPECRNIGTMLSEGDDFRCTGCGYKVHFNEYNFFEPRTSNLHFDSIRDWNLWQIEYLQGYLSSRVPSDSSDPIFEDTEIRLHTGYRSDPLVYAGKGILRLHPGKMVFVPADDGDELEIPIPEIAGLSVHEDEKLEFYYKDTLYSFDNENKRRSMYKWYKSLGIIQNN